MRFAERIAEINRRHANDRRRAIEMALGVIEEILDCTKNGHDRADDALYCERCGAPLFGSPRRKDN